MSHLPRLTFLWFSLLPALSCASGEPAGGDGATEGGQAGRAGGVAGVSGNAGVGGPSGSGGSSVVIGTAGDNGDAGEAACVGEVHEAERVRVDIVLMLDRSSSMLEPTPSGGTKWEAIISAIDRFSADPASAGLGLGAQYFPLRRMDTPEECWTDSDCGAAGPCLKVCRGAFDTGQPIYCTNHTQCGTGMNCVPVGRCSGQPETVCTSVGASCNPAAAGLCEAAASTCFYQFSCEPDDYSEAAVPIAALPGAHAALIASLKRETPAGSTPTGVALQGAIAHARRNSEMNDARTVVLLATDGLPSDCSPTEADAIAEIASDGLQGTPSVLTYLIGVSGDATEARESALLMNAVASAGGTESAFLIDANADVTTEFLAALSQIRTLALPCDFQIPPAPEGQVFDYGRVNIEVTRDGGDADALGYVTAESECDADGGWYYDVDPASGDTPSAIRVCPATCSEFEQAPTISIDIRLGCATVIRPPR